MSSLTNRAAMDEESYEQFQALSSQVSDLENLLLELREQADRLPSLSSTTLIELDRVESRLRTLRDQVDTEQRRKLSSSVSASVSPSNNTFDPRFNDPLPAGWERGLNEDKVPYYLNHDEQKTQWDHPLFSDLLDSLLNFNTVKYSAYRLALKLRKVQQRLCLDLLDMEAAV